MPSNLEPGAESSPGSWYTAGRCAGCAAAGSATLGTRAVPAASARATRADERMSYLRRGWSAQPFGTGWGTSPTVAQSAMPHIDRMDASRPPEVGLRSSRMDEEVDLRRPLRRDGGEAGADVSPDIGPDAGVPR